MDVLLLVTDDAGRLRALDYPGQRSRMERLLTEHHGTHTLVSGKTPDELAARLDSYFAGDLRALAHVEISTAGTAFEERVWSQMRAIPPGQTRSYGQVAKELGLMDPLAVREIGGVNNANPIAIVTPCHRVFEKNGELNGYARCTRRKRWLLEHERAPPALTPSLSADI